MNYLEMGKRRGWFKSLCIIAMCLTELSGSVNILCYKFELVCGSYIDLNIISISQGSFSAILVDHSLDNPTDV